MLRLPTHSHNTPPALNGQLTVRFCKLLLWGKLILQDSPDEVQKQTHTLLLENFNLIFNGISGMVCLGMLCCTLHLSALPPCPHPLYSFHKGTRCIQEPVGSSVLISFLNYDRQIAWKTRNSKEFPALGTEVKSIFNNIWSCQECFVVG